MRLRLSNLDVVSFFEHFQIGYSRHYFSFFVIFFVLLTAENNYMNVYDRCNLLSDMLKLSDLVEFLSRGFMLITLPPRFILESICTSVSYLKKK